MAIVTLTSDFGQTDHYVAAMKGVILSIAPSATLVDVTHEIPPQDVQHGAFVLRQACATFPAGTIHIAVVDPTVGTSRRLVALAAGHQMFLAPDNGLLSLVCRDFPTASARVIVPTTGRDARPPSHTFHGRDILAPAAGRLAAGQRFDDLGPPAGELIRLSLPPVIVDAGGARHGCVIHIDHYGNLVTNLDEKDVTACRHDGVSAATGLRVRVGAQEIGPVRRTYADAPAGELVAYVGSSHLIEIAVNEGDAASRLGARRGSAVTLYPVPEQA